MEKVDTNKWETASTIAWFSMDACWKMGWLIPAYGLITVNLILMAMAAKEYTETRDMIAQGALMSWLGMNIFWMLGEEDPMYNPWSTGFMCIGSILIVILLAMDGGAGRVLRRFRIR